MQAGPILRIVESLENGFLYLIRVFMHAQFLACVGVIITLVYVLVD